MVRPDGFAGPVIADVRGRDIHRRRDGSFDVLDEVRLVLDVDGLSGDVMTVGGDQPGPGRHPLEGANVRRGFGRAIVAAMPDEAARRSLLFSVLEDLNGALLVSGYAPLRQGLLGGSKEDGVVRAEAQQDVCAGWARGGPLVELLRSTGETAVPIGPPAPPITSEDGRWHAMAVPQVHMVRRLRCLDLSIADLESGVMGARAHFRDSYVGEGEGGAEAQGEGKETVMHEYLVRARFDRQELVLKAVDVEPRVLPWQSCPEATSSADALIGVRVDDLPRRVRAELVGTSTCTHLNSTLRSLADVGALRTVLEGLDP